MPPAKNNWFFLLLVEDREIRDLFIEFYGKNLWILGAERIQVVYETINQLQIKIVVEDVPYVKFRLLIHV